MNKADPWRIRYLFLRMQCRIEARISNREIEMP